MTPGTICGIKCDLTVVKIELILGHKTGSGIRPVLTLRIAGMSTEIIGLVLGQTLYEGKLAKLCLNIL